MEKITEGRSKRKVTQAMIQQRRLNTQFELMAKYGMRKGDLFKVTRPVPGQTSIEKEPMPEGKDYTETTYRDFLAEDLVKFIDICYDWWSGDLFLEFIDGDVVLFYNWDQMSSPGDTSFGEIFTKVLDSTIHYGII